MTELVTQLPDGFCTKHNVAYTRGRINSLDEVFGSCARCDREREQLDAVREQGVTKLLQLLDGNREAVTRLLLANCGLPERFLDSIMPPQDEQALAWVQNFDPTSGQNLIVLGPRRSGRTTLLASVLYSTLSCEWVLRPEFQGRLTEYASGVRLLERHAAHFNEGEVQNFFREYGDLGLLVVDDCESLADSAAVLETIVTLRFNKKLCSIFASTDRDALESVFGSKYAVAKLLDRATVIQLPEIDRSELSRKRAEAGKLGAAKRWATQLVGGS